MNAKQARKNERKRAKKEEARISCGGIGPAMHGQCKCTRKAWEKGAKYAFPKDPHLVTFDDLAPITREILENQVEVIRCKK